MGDDQAVLIGVSTCLMGQTVRWDGRHKLDPYLTGTLGRHVALVPVCPEAELGMGIPREPVSLHGDPESPRMIGNTSGEDWTDRMNRWCCRKLKDLVSMGLSGYVLKRGSPSCGLERVRLLDERGGRSKRVGTGLFAAQLRRHLPLLPVQEAEHLDDPDRRDQFIERVFAYHRLRRFFAGGRVRRGDVVAFHARQKYLLMAHSPKHYKQLGGLVARIKTIKPAEFRCMYEQGYMDALAVRATPRKHVNVLQHLLGYLKNQLGSAEREDILRVIELYRAGAVPLLVPLTLLNHHVTVHQIEYLHDQVYLQPASEELALRNHA